MTPLELREIMEEHGFDGYDDDQVWAHCRCGDTYLDTNGHLAEVIARMQRDRDETVRREARHGYISIAEHELATANLSRQIYQITDTNRSLSMEVATLKRRKIVLERRARDAALACGTALKNGPWSNVRWTIGIRAIMNELTGETEGANLLKDWVPVSIKATEKPWVRGGDKWRRHGKDA